MLLVERTVAAPPAERVGLRVSLTLYAMGGKAMLISVKESPRE